MRIEKLAADIFLNAKRRSRRAAAALLVGLLLPIAAQAQDPPKSISPLQVEPDRNGVNIVTGKMAPEALVLSVPAAPRLKFDRVQNAAPHVTGQVLTDWNSDSDKTSEYTVHTADGVSESFRCVWSIDGKSCASVTRSGSMLNFGATDYRRGGSGERYSLNLVHIFQVPPPGSVNQQKKRFFYASKIEYPDGEIISYTYNTATLPGDPYSRTFYRPVRVESNLGYYITIAYQGNDLTQMGWGTASEAALYNVNAPGTPLARLTDSGSGTVTDLAGRVYQGYNLGTLGLDIETASFSRTLPTESAPTITATPATGLPSTAQMVGTVNRDGVAWNYSYANPQYYLGIDGYLYDSVTATGPNGYSKLYTITKLGSLSPTGNRNLITRTTDELGRQTNYEYDIGLRVTKITYPENNSVTIGWDDAGNVVSKTSVAKPGTGLANIVEQSFVDLSAYYNGDGYLDCREVILCYRPTWHRDALGRQTDFVYNTRGQLIEQTDPADANGVRRKTYIEYEAFDTGFGIISRKKVVRICGATTTCGTNAEIRTEFEYSDQVLLPSVERQLDAATGQVREHRYTHDAAGHVLSVDGPQPGWDDTEYVRYDTLGRTIWEVGALAPNGLRAAKRYTYRNADDSIVSVETGTLPDATSVALTAFERTDMSYDSRRNIIREATSASGQAFRVTDRSYLDRGLPDCTATRMNLTALPTASAIAACSPGTQGAYGPDRIVKNLYDTAGQLERIQQAYGTTLVRNYVSYGYTLNGKQQFVTDGNGNKAQYTYDGHDRKSHWYFPDKNVTGNVSSGDYEQYGYDAVGNRISLRRRDGRTLTFGYDSINRMTSKIVPDGCAPIQLGPCSPALATRDVYYTYDLMGRQLTAKFDTDAGADGISYTYDAFGDTRSTIISMGGFSKTLTANYDEAGRRTRLTHPDGQSFTYIYDGLDRLSGLYEGLDTTVPLAQFSYNVRGLVASRSERFGSGMSFTYDSIGRLGSQSSSFAAGTGNVTTGSIVWNPASQMVSAIRDNDLYVWRDAVTVNRNYSRNGLNQYVSAGPANFLYDANGNLISDGTSSYVYDAENRLISASNGASLTYDPVGRLWRIVKGVSDLRFLYDGNDLVAEYDNNGVITARYVHGNDTDSDDPIVWYSTNSARWLHSNSQGSVIAVTDEAGAVRSINTYDEYGIPGTANGGRFQYTGQAWITELGMNYYKARFYSPTLGRFLQTDPVGYESNSNLYTYVSNDPVNRVDPTGLQDAYRCAKLGQGCGAHNGTSTENLTNFLRGIASYPQDIAASVKWVAGISGLSGQAAQNRARLVTQLGDNGFKYIKHNPGDFAKAVGNFALNNKAFLGGRLGAGALVTRGTGPTFGAALGTASFLGGGLRALNNVVSDMEGAGFDASKLSDRTAGHIAAAGMLGASAKFDAKSGNVSASFTTEPRTGTRLPKTQTMVICNVNSERGCK